MFKHRTASTAALDERLAALHTSNDTWFDNTIESVDRRIAQVRPVVTELRARVASAGGGDLIEVTASLEESLRELGELRTALLDAPTEEALPTRRISREMFASLPPFARQEVEVSSRTFLAANLDAQGNRAELAVRSGHEAHRIADRLPATPSEKEIFIEAFVDAVQRRAEALPQRREARVASQPSVDWADDLLFD